MALKFAKTAEKTPFLLRGASFTYPEPLPEPETEEIESDDSDEVDEDGLFDLFKAVLLAHIGTKTVDSQFHTKSEGFYTVLFDCFHQIKEKEQDMEDDKPMDCQEAAKIAYDSLEKAKETVKNMIARKNSPGMDNLLRGLYDKLEFACGDARAFIKK